jgi:formylglycine-generating enzyme required for sulfatase activity
MKTASIARKTLFSFEKIISKSSRKFLLIFCLAFTISNAKGNNLVISSVSVVGANLQFTIAWDNSWNTNIGPTNWDAVWVFVKRQSCSDNLWTHSLLSINSGDHSITGGLLQVDAVTDGMGVFIRRAANGYGNNTAETVTLSLQTAANLVDNFQVFGVEMVSVPQNDFYIGDNGAAGSGSNAWGFKSVLITNAIQTAGIGIAGNYKQNGGWGSTVALPAAFPLGWNNFYCMKYEISQEQYATFLNSLTFTQQIARTAVNPASAVGTLAIAPLATPSRNRIEIKTSGVSSNTPAIYACDLNNDGVYNNTDDGQNTACNYLAWSDLIAYLDWSGLRPMTEFEFEKVCRGTSPAALNGEFAWSALNLLQAESGALTNPGQSSEVSTASGSGLCAYGANSAAKGPLRCGFAAGAATNRAQAGGAFYGAMDMSGNVMEQCIGGYNFNYSAFTTANGDGSLTVAGLSNTAGWPINGGGQGGGVGRGSDWFTVNTTFLTISDCAYMTSNINQTRSNLAGGRGVRNY